MIDFTFGGTEEDFLQGDNDLAKFFSSHALGTTPIGSISAPDSDGRRRFSFIVYFPYQYCQYLSTEFSSTGLNQDWEVIRTSYGLKESVSTRTINTKTI